MGNLLAARVNLNSAQIFDSFAQYYCDSFGANLTDPEISRAIIFAVFAANINFVLPKFSGSMAHFSDLNISKLLRIAHLY